MRPHEERVVNEKAELDEKIAKLEAFINFDGRFVALSPLECELLRQQRDYMHGYSNILGARIAAFPPERSDPGA